MSKLLTDLPPELLSLTLSHLADLDIRSLLVARSTCKAFKAHVQDVLKITSANYGLSLHEFATTYFPALLDSSIAEGRTRYLQSCDNLAPLRTLPWTSDPISREKWERKDASWCRLPLVTETGIIVRPMQAVTIFRRDDEVEYLRGRDILFPLCTLWKDENFANDEKQDYPGGAGFYPPSVWLSVGYTI